MSNIWNNSTNNRLPRIIALFWCEKINNSSRLLFEEIVGSFLFKKNDISLHLTLKRSAGNFDFTKILSKCTLKSIFFVVLTAINHLRWMYFQVLCISALTLNERLPPGSCYFGVWLRAKKTAPTHIAYCHILSFDKYEPETGDMVFCFQIFDSTGIYYWRTALHLKK